MMTTMRAVMLSTLVAGVALAQVQVNSGGKSVTVTPDGVEAQKGAKNVKVKTGGTAVQVEGTDEAGAAKQVEVKTGGGTTTVKSGDGKAVVVDGAGPVPAAATDGKWQVDGQGRSETHACAANEDVMINGQGHAITLTGPCRSVTVSGQGNAVKVDVAERIQVSGMSNSASWKAGAGGKKPKISLSGMGNTAPQMK